MKRIIGVLSLGILLLPSVSLAAFDTDLRYGSSGDSVLELQEFLTEQGVYSGPISGNFFSLTLAGVKAYQAKEGIQPTSGFFGPLTRANANTKLSADLKDSDEEASSTPVVVAPSRTPAKSNPVSTGGEPVTDAFQVSSSASATGTSVTFRLTPHIDEVSIKLSQNGGKWEGYSRTLKNSEFTLDGMENGTYNYEITAYQYGPSGKFDGYAAPFDGKSAQTSGTFTIQ